MIDVFPHARATLQASSYFSGTLSGYLNADGVFKVFKRNEAVGGLDDRMETPFTWVEIVPGQEDQDCGWFAPHILFHNVGTDADWALLYALSQQEYQVFKNLNAFASVGGANPYAYQLVGAPLFDEGEDPVTETVYASVSLQFGIG